MRLRCCRLGVLMALCASSVWADPVSIIVRGGAAAPQAEEPDVRMVSEDLRVDLYDCEAVVQASMVFANEGPQQDVLMGFPQVNYHGAREVVLQDVRFVVDGQEVETRHMPQDERENPLGLGPEFAFVSWYVADIPFDAGQTRTIEIAYRHGHGGSAFGWDWFPYLLHTASKWKGPVDTISVAVNYREGVERIDEISPQGGHHDEAARRIAWRFGNYEGEPKEIVVRWRPKPLMALINGQPAKLGASISADGPIADIASGATALGYAWKPGSDGGRQVVEGRAHQLEVSALSREATLDGRPFRLIRAPWGELFEGTSIQRCCWLAAEDLRRAIGLRWTYDPASRQLDLQP